MMPVIYPEDCTPGSWQEVQPACDRATKWVGGAAPPPGVADITKRDSFCIQVRAAGVVGGMVWLVGG